MNFKLVLMAFIFCFINNAYANQPDIHITLLGESLEDGHSSTIRIHAGDDILYTGLSLSHIESSNVIQYDNRKTIHPIYFFVGLKAPTKLSPFLEAGIDLPEALIDDLLNNEEESESQADYYFSTGLVLAATDKVSFSVFAKKYHFIFRENIYAPTTKTRPHSYGVGVSFRF